MTSFVRILWAAVFLLVSFTSIDAFSEDFSLRWGLILPLSGPVAKTGTDIKRGFEMAVADLKDSNVKHELFFEDSKYEAKTAVTAAQKLLSIDHVDILFSIWDTADAVAPIAEGRDVLNLAIRWNYNIALNNKNTFTFESTYEDYTRMFALIFKSLNYKKVSIITEESPGWNLARDTFIKFAEHEGLEILSSQTFLPGETDFKVIALKALKGNPDVVLVNEIAETLELIAKRIYEIKPTQNVTGYLDYPVDLNLFNGQHYVTQMLVEPGFLARYESLYGEPVDSRAHLAYDVFNILDSVSKEFKTKPSTKDLREKLTQAPERLGKSGLITTANGGKVFKTQVHHMKIEDGKKIEVNP